MKGFKILGVVSRSLTGKAIVLSLAGKFDPQKLPGDTVALWKLVSRALLLRSEGRCEECGFKNTNVHVHHRNGCGLDNRLENLIVLCASCHMKHHHPKTDVNLLPRVTRRGMYGKSRVQPTIKI